MILKHVTTSKNLFILDDEIVVESEWLKETNLEEYEEVVIMETKELHLLDSISLYHPKNLKKNKEDPSPGSEFHNYL